METPPIQEAIIQAERPLQQLPQNQQHPAPVNGNAYHSSSKRKPIIIALIYVVIIFFEWLYPAPENYDPVKAELLKILNFPLMVFILVTGSNFTKRMIKIGRGAAPDKKYQYILVGILGGLFIIVVGIISGLIFVSKVTGPRAPGFF